MGELLAFLNESMPALKWKLRGVELRAGMFHGDYTVEVDLRPVTEEERQRKTAQGVVLKGILSGQEIYEDYLMRENWHESQVQRLAESVINTPEFVKQAMAYAFGQQIAPAEGEKPKGESGVVSDELLVLDRLAQQSRAARRGYAPTLGAGAEEIRKYTRGMGWTPTGQ
jgi:hypothetical protein